jgi:hypothetical protein
MSGVRKPAISPRSGSASHRAPARSNHAGGGSDPRLKVLQKVEGSATEESIAGANPFHRPIRQRLRRAAEITGGVLAIHPPVRMNEDARHFSFNFHGPVPFFVRPFWTVQAHQSAERIVFQHMTCKMGRYG